MEICVPASKGTNEINGLKLNSTLKAALHRGVLSQDSSFNKKYMGNKCFSSYYRK